MQQELSLAFIWHFHQPDYRAQSDGIRLMPWSRLHAVKDYLDMVRILDKFPKLKLNFTFDPALADTVEDYAENEAHDIHSKMTVTPVDELTDDDKLFILNYFFDACYDTMIAPNKRYNELYLKRYGKSDIGTEDFTDEEYSDIMFLFNYVWIDPVWREKNPELRAFEEKKSGYTLEDRKRLIEIQRGIMKQIIPAYQKYHKEGRIEIVAVPYNHPILPILVNPADVKSSSLKHPLPDCKINLAGDAKEQITASIERATEIFGKRPLGIWPAEQCISVKTLELFSGMGFLWTVTDESILSASLKKEFVRDFRGCYEDPYDVCSVYEFGNKGDKTVNLIFRDSVIANLISFEYSHHRSEFCANDLFDRIKTVYDKLKNSPDESHILTIAMDGENCWENYEKDGLVFLEKLYSLITNDTNIKTVLVSEYMMRDTTAAKPLKKIVPGGSGNTGFQLWIAEPTKNLAWQYLINARNALKEAEKFGSVPKEAIAKAKKEIFTAESSDWFWWYGEPNNSGQDHIFDYLYREHLKNVYISINQPVPSYLEMPLTAMMGKPLREPRKNITPVIDGKNTSREEWINAGCIDIPDGPVLQENKIFNRIYFGSDDEKLYFRFDINNYVVENNDNYKDLFSIYIYIKTYNRSEISPIRTTNKTNKIYPVLFDGYNYELKIISDRNFKHPFQFSKAIKNRLWQMQWEHKIRCVYEDVMEIEIPFEDINVKKGDSFEFLFLTGCAGVTENVYPKDIPLSMTRGSFDTAKENPSFV